MKREARRGWLGLLVVATAVFALDQGVKASVRSSLAFGERRDFIGPVDLVYVRNHGVAFGFLNGHGWLVPLLTIIALVGVGAWFAANPTRPDAWLPAGMLLGGAAGNIWDRLDSGAVTDFIKLPYWPAFNVADIAITIGVVLLVIVSQRSQGDG